MKGTIVKKPQAVIPVEKQKEHKGVPVHAGYGIVWLFVCTSILYANYVVFFGTEGWLPKVMLIPSTLLVAVFLVLKAVK